MMMPAITAPQMPIRPKATKYCIISWPEANPAPTMSPTTAMAMAAERFNMVALILVSCAGDGG